MSNIKNKSFILDNFQGLYQLKKQFETDLKEKLVEGQKINGCMLSNTHKTVFLPNGLENFKKKYPNSCFKNKLKPVKEIQKWNDERPKNLQIDINKLIKKYEPTLIKKEKNNDKSK